MSLEAPSFIYKRTEPGPGAPVTQSHGTNRCRGFCPRIGFFFLKRWWIKRNKLAIFPGIWSPDNASVFFIPGILEKDTISGLSVLDERRSCPVSPACPQHFSRCQRPATPTSIYFVAENACKPRCPRLSEGPRSFPARREKQRII